MKEPTQEHLNFEFIDGRSADVSIYQSDKGTMVLVTQDHVNPFNHGDELAQFRDVIADRVSKSLEQDPSELRYVEQAGNHYQTIPMERSPEGTIRIPERTRIMHEPAERVESMIREHESQQIDPHLAHGPDWASHLQVSDDNSFNR